MCRHLLEADPLLSLSVSATTRLPRPGERDGKDYIFMTTDQFAQGVQENAFLEHACVFGNHYGTLKTSVEPKLQEGLDVLFDIDWQGARQLSSRTTGAFVHPLVRIFLLPPSLDTLRKRLIERGQDSQSTVEERMQKAQAEITHADEYDYILINEDLSQTVAQAQAIIQAARLAKGVSENVERLIKELLQSGDAVTPAPFS